MQVNDRVRRISGKDLPELGIVLGGVYEVESIGRNTDDFVCKLKGINGGWFQSNFEVVSPRPHADIIRAYADGAEIQVFDNSAPYVKTWVDIEYPTFHIDEQYRIKPTAAQIKAEKVEQIKGMIDLVEQNWTTANNAYVTEHTALIVELNQVENS